MLELALPLGQVDFDLDLDLEFEGLEVVQQDAVLEAAQLVVELEAVLALGREVVW